MVSAHLSLHTALKEHTSRSRTRVMQMIVYLVKQVTIALK